MDLLGKHAGALETVLDLTSERHRVIQRNLANVNTPGYEAQELRFDEALGEATLESRKGINPRQDGNTVVLEFENAEMRKNALVHRIYLQAMIHEVRMVRSAIAGRSS